MTRIQVRWTEDKLPKNREVAAIYWIDLIVCCTPLSQISYLLTFIVTSALIFFRSFVLCCAVLY